MCGPDDRFFSGAQRCYAILEPSACDAFRACEETVLRCMCSVCRYFVGWQTTCLHMKIACFALVASRMAPQNVDDFGHLCHVDVSKNLDTLTLEVQQVLHPIPAHHLTLSLSEGSQDGLLKLHVRVHISFRASPSESSIIGESPSRFHSSATNVSTADTDVHRKQSGKVRQKLQWHNRTDTRKCLGSTGTLQSTLRNGGGKRQVVTPGHPSDTGSNMDKRVRLTRKTRPSASSQVIPDPGHPTPRRWKRLRPPSSVGEGGEVGVPRNLFPRLGVG